MNSTFAGVIIIDRNDLLTDSPQTSIKNWLIFMDDNCTSLIKLNITFLNHDTHSLDMTERL